MKKIYNIIRYALFILSMCAFFTNLFIKTNITANICAVLILLNSILLVFVSKKNWCLLIISLFILYSNYSICFSSYINILESSFFTSYANTITSFVSIGMLLLFIAIFTFLLSFIKEDTMNDKVDVFNNNKYNLLLCIGLIAVLMIIFVYGFKRPNNSGERGTESSLYEYSIILLLIGYYYSGKSNILKFIFSFLLFCFSIKNFIYGGRIIGIQLLSLFFLLFITKYINKKTIVISIPILIIGCFLMIIIGEQRANLNLSFETLINILKKTSNNWFTLDTAYSAYFTSMTFVETAKIVGYSERLKLFFKFILSMIFGGSLIKDSSLPNYTRQYFEHWYGGVLPFYAYFYIGYLGIIIITIYISTILKKLLTNIKNKDFNKLALIYISATIPRWYLYSPSNIFRGILLLCLCYYLTLSIHNFMIFLLKNKFKIKNIKVFVSNGGEKDGE